MGELASRLGHWALAIGAIFVIAMLAGACSDTGKNAERPSAATSTSTTVDSPDDLTPPAGPQETAALLVRVEAALRSPATPAAEVARLGWEQQLAYRGLVAHPEWTPQVLTAMPAGLRPAVAANARAGSSLATLAGAQLSLPDWRIEAPPAPEVLIGYYRAAEAATGIGWPYLAAIHLVETRMGRIRGTSPAGAQGPMQFLPATWEAYGEGDINDPRASILGAGRYLAANGGRTDISRALFAYNHSLRYVNAVQSYADVIATGQELAYRGYYQWQVYFATTDGVALLPEGYPQRPAVFTRK